jgi:hypothetical protein
MAVAQEELEDTERSVTLDLTYEAKNMLIAVGVGASTDEGRPVLTCIDLTLHADGKLEAVTTDSYLLVHREVQFPSVIAPKNSDPVHVMVNAADLKRALSLARKMHKNIRLQPYEVPDSSPNYALQMPIRDPGK